jgi:hypothetical protein
METIMTNLLSLPQHGSRILLFWGAAILVYFFMVFGTLADIEWIAGVRAFDMRPTGYSYRDALELISALGDEGRRIYLMRQIPLDTVYPALLAISSASSLNWLSKSFGSTARWYRAVAPMAYLAAAADYVENGLIVWMLNAGRSVPEAVVSAASMASVSKSILSTIVFTALLVALAEFTIRRMRRMQGI